MGLQGVVTTGIYCRAECSARPDPKNVRPMRNAVEAMAAGYRPCLLCRPDRLPGLGFAQPVAEVAHALRLIADGYLDGETTEALAERIGYSTRQLVRLFKQHVGASPDFVARARRAHLARRLLDESSLSIADVALGAGFRSTRQMGRVMRELFGFSPTALRTKRRRGDRLGGLDGGLRLRIPDGTAVPVERILGYLGARAIPGVEALTERGYLRTVNTCGYPGLIELRRARSEGHLEAVMHLATFGSILDLVGRARALFGLDLEVEGAREHLLRDRHLAPLVRREPGLRLPGAWDRFETAVRILVGQQVSVAGATTVTGALVERYGAPVETPLPAGLARLFPSPEALAAASPGSLAMPRARAETIVRFAAAVASGELDLRGRASLDETIAELERLRGVGPWSAHLIAARVMGHPDAFPTSDLGLRRAASRMVGAQRVISARELEELSQRWRPFRSFAAIHLWMSETPRREAMDHEGSR